MPLVGLEPTIPAGERPQTYALDRADRAATGTGSDFVPVTNKGRSPCDSAHDASVLLTFLELHGDTSTITLPSTGFALTPSI